MEETVAVQSSITPTIKSQLTQPDTFFFLKCSSMSLIIGSLSVATNTTLAFDSDKTYSSNLSHSTILTILTKILYNSQNEI